VIDVAVADEDIARTIGNVDGVADLTDEDASDGGLHNSFQANAVCLGMFTGDFEIADQGHALALPDDFGEVFGSSAFAMRAEEGEGRAATCHDDFGVGAESLQGDATGFGKIDLNCARDAIIAGGKFDEAVAVFESVLDGIGIVELAVAGSTKIANATHGCVSRGEGEGVLEVDLVFAEEGEGFFVGKAFDLPARWVVVGRC